MTEIVLLKRENSTDLSPKRSTLRGGIAVMHNFIFS